MKDILIKQTKIYTDQPSVTYALDKLEDELILKDVLFLGAGLGLFLAFRILKGVRSPQFSGCLICSPY